MKKLEIDPKAKGLIFDLDGTLGDTMPIHFKAYREVLKDYGIEFDWETFMNLAGIPAIGIIAELNKIYGTSMDPESVGTTKEAQYEKLMHEITPIGPVVDLVKKYHGILPMSIGTGGYHHLAWKTVDILGLKDYFEILVCAEDVENHKPHPETFLRCAELMGVEPENCQVFEDGEPGMRAARNGGMMATLVTDYFEMTK